MENEVTTKEKLINLITELEDDEINYLYIFIINKLKKVDSN